MLKGAFFSLSVDRDSPEPPVVPILVGPTDLYLLRSQLYSCIALLQVINHDCKGHLLFGKLGIFLAFFHSLSHHLYLHSYGKVLVAGVVLGWLL